MGVSDHRAQRNDCGAVISYPWPRIDDPRSCNLKRHVGECGQIWCTVVGGSGSDIAAPRALIIPAFAWPGNPRGSWGGIPHYRMNIVRSPGQPYNPCDT